MRILIDSGELKRALLGKAKTFNRFRLERETATDGYGTLRLMEDQKELAKIETYCDGRDLDFTFSDLIKKSAFVDFVMLLEQQPLTMEFGSALTLRCLKTFKK